VEPIEKAKSRADELVSGYRAVVERTKEFVDNLKALRALGLDPMLFNQLVEAGVEAGGETARALVEGGSDTVNEVNSLFAELDALGMELGENTAQVMYGQGENFVNGIVEGLTAQAGELEISAKSIAEAFTTTFEQVLIDGINAAIDAAEAAMARMPRIEDFVGDFNFQGPAGPAPAPDFSDQPGFRPEGFQYPSPPKPVTGALARGVEVGIPGALFRGVDVPQPISSPTRVRQPSGVTYNVYAPSVSSRSLLNSLGSTSTKVGTIPTRTRGVINRGN